MAGDLRVASVHCGHRVPALKSPIQLLPWPGGTCPKNVASRGCCERALPLKPRTTCVCLGGCDGAADWLAEEQRLLWRLRARDLCWRGAFPCEPPQE